MRTAICARFGVEFPLFAFSHRRDVVAAVTNAGGLGVLGAVGYSADRLEAELSWIDAQVGGRPYGVDVLVPGRIDAAAAGPGTRLADLVPERHRDFVSHLFAKYGVSGGEPYGGGPVTQPAEFGHRITGEGATGLVEVALKHPVALVAAALGPPPPELVALARRAGVPVAALVGTVEHARRQVAAGADLIVAQGGEAGGHTGEISTMVLVPQVVDAVDVPVLAAGGIASGRQMAAAMALGAEGVWCGSVWLTTEEAETPPVVVRKLLAATSRDTTRSPCRTGKPARQLTSAWTEEWDDATESPGPLPMPWQALLAEGAMSRIIRSAESGDEGALRLASHFVGQVVGQLNEVKPVRRVVHEIMEEFAGAAERLRRISAG
ncbi:monooxygenase [Microtetraspora sp. NBRC 13810]|uniref:NAD(P)H-dependent flavin oxidoreductase n=1 Tax=Microtetraspora sp. NBRC 13810 TaxID=3030990 RepID=UPI00249FE617|nr:nitronate monooxygenase family protein [Microtetraspora sp. NBRC 13810]GLW12261.1 monooxygenase [Microtetraspora sp. NBRC 13810]